MAQQTACNMPKKTHKHPPIDYYCGAAEMNASITVCGEQLTLFWLETGQYPNSMERLVYPRNCA